MRWQNRERSTNVDDRRKGGSVRKVGGGIGIGVILIAVFQLIMGENPVSVLQNVLSESAPSQTSGPATTNAADDELADFVSVVLKDTEDVWEKLFKEELGRQYQPPTLVLFSGSVQSACGSAQSATGPFYCPADQKVYIDLVFYQELKNRFKAPGDFAMAYIVAHEVGHHVQSILGISSQVEMQKRKVSKKEANQLSVRLELQADFLAGVWAHHGQKMKNFLEKGDIEEAMNAAAAVGDDRIQLQARGYVVPDAFTHGTSEQRMRWFKKGLLEGKLKDGDTFSEYNL
jgi:predicted metalloprotease